MLEICVKENSTEYWKILNDRLILGKSEYNDLHFPGGLA
jgi:hypothetical protein